MLATELGSWVTRSERVIAALWGRLILLLVAGVCGWARLDLLVLVNTLGNTCCFWVCGVGFCRGLGSSCFLVAVIELAFCQSLIFCSVIYDFCRSRCLFPCAVARYLVPFRWVLKCNSLSKIGELRSLVGTFRLNRVLFVSRH
jgi:hypothetical protein